MLCLGLVTWIVGVLPLLGVRKGWLKESESQQTQTMVNIFSALTCFSGGVILTSCLTHMLPDVNEVLVEAIESVFVFFKSWIAGVVTLQEVFSCMICSKDIRRAFPKHGLFYTQG